MRSPDHYIVEMFSIHDEADSKGFALPQKTRHTGDDNGREGLNPNKTLCTHGTILEEPVFFSDSIVYPKGIGSPEPRTGIHSEQLAMLHNRGITEYTYYPSPYVPTKVTRADIYKNILNKGDTLHFYYKANPFIVPKNILEQSETNEVGFFGQKKTRYVVKIDVVHSVCSSRDGKINAIADGITIGSKVMQSQSDIMTRSGILTKSSVQPKYLTAKIEHSRVAKMGDTVLYIPHANFEMDICGKRYYVIKDGDVLCNLTD